MIRNNLLTSQVNISKWFCVLLSAHRCSILGVLSVVISSFFFEKFSVYHLIPGCIPPVLCVPQVGNPWCNALINQPRGSLHLQRNFLQIFPPGLHLQYLHLQLKSLGSFLPLSKLKKIVATILLEMVIVSSL